MKFSLYSEMQNWPPKPPAQQYRETLEQIVNADRLGFDAYARRRALLLPEVLDLARPAAALRGRRAAHRPDRLPHARATCCRTTTRPSWPRGSASPDILLDGRYEFGVGRGHGWIPLQRRRPARGDEGPLRGVARDPLRGARERRVLVRRAASTRSPTRTSSRGPTGASASSSAARATRRTSSPAGAAGRWSCRRCCPYEALRDQLDLYRRTCAEHGNEPGHRLDPRLLHGRGPRHRAARGRGGDEGLPRRATRRR